MPFRKSVPTVKDEATSTRRKLRWPAAAAICVAVLLPLTAFAGIGAWNGVQKVILGTAVELAAPVSTEPTSTESKSTEPKRHQTEQSRHTQGNDESQPGFLGVSTASLSGQLRSHFGVPDELGVLISNVNDDSAAYLAGLQAGDIITRVNGESIEDGSDLRRAVRRAGAESQVTIEVYRDGEALDFSATLGAAKDRGRSYSYTWSGDDNDNDNDNDWDRNRDQRFAWSEDDIDDFAERMEAFGERMAEWGEHFGEDFGEDWAARFEEHGEEFGRRMEAWGEEFGQRMEERFENGDWDETNFRFGHSGIQDGGTWNAEEFEEAMENLSIELEDLDLEGISAIVEEAMGSLDFDSLGETITDALERAMEALDDNRHRE